MANQESVQSAVDQNQTTTGKRQVDIWNRNFKDRIRKPQPQCRCEKRDPSKRPENFMYRSAWPMCSCDVITWLNSCLNFVPEHDIVENVQEAVRRNNIDGMQFSEMTEKDPHLVQLGLAKMSRIALQISQAWIREYRILPKPQGRYFPDNCGLCEECAPPCQDILQECRLENLKHEEHLSIAQKLSARKDRVRRHDASQGTERSQQKEHTQRLEALKCKEASNRDERSQREKHSRHKERV